MKLLFCVRATKSDSPPIGKFGKRFFFLSEQSDYASPCGH